MVSDKANERLKDFLVSPVKKSSMALGYYFASMLSTLLVCFIAFGLCLIYHAIVGWTFSVSDIFWSILDIFILVNFGTAISSVIHFFLKSQGQMIGVGVIVSSCYGFFCGAYFPISNFPEALQKVISFLPGTYGTALLRYHLMNTTLEKLNFPADVNKSILESVDAQLKFFGNDASVLNMYLILAGSTIGLIGLYILFNALKKRSS